MHTVPLKLVTIVAEPVLEEQLVELLHRLGARGHTVTDSRGAGSRGLPRPWSTRTSTSSAKSWRTWASTRLMACSPTSGSPPTRWTARAEG